MSGQRIGENVKAARLASGMSQEQLAHKLGVSVFTVSRLERGATKTVTPEKLARIAKALRVSVESLGGVA